MRGCGWGRGRGGWSRVSGQCRGVANEGVWLVSLPPLSKVVCVCCVHVQERSTCGCSSLQRRRAAKVAPLLSIRRSPPLRHRRLCPASPPLLPSIAVVTTPPPHCHVPSSLLPTQRSQAVQQPQRLPPSSPPNRRWWCVRRLNGSAGKRSQTPPRRALFTDARTT